MAILGMKLLKIRGITEAKIQALLPYAEKTGL